MTVGVVVTAASRLPRRPSAEPGPYPACVDKARLRFLFGAVPAVVPGDEDGRAALMRADGRGGAADPSLRLVVANQILDGDPPATWDTVQRLLGRGIGRHDVMDQLVRTLRPFVDGALHDQRRFDSQEYTAALARLPLPDRAAVLETYLDVARAHVTIGADELEELVAARLGLDPDDPMTEQLLDDTDRAVMEDPGSPVSMLPPDIVVHVPALMDGIVLTHRLSAAEKAEDFLDLDNDLAGFRRCPNPRVDAGPLHVDDPGGADPVSWDGPLDWLSDLVPGALLAVRATADGELTISVLDAEPTAPPGLVEAVRAAYDAEVEEPWLPVSAEDLVLQMLHRDRTAFARPRPPLTELAAAAGLERRGVLFAHDESVWKAADDIHRLHRLMDQVGPGQRGLAAMEAFELVSEESDNPASLRRALDLLTDPEILVAVTDELLGPGGDGRSAEDPGRVTALVALADRLCAAARSASRTAVAGWVAAVAAERDGRVLDAESHLRAASRAGAGWPFVEDRLAWYESDRGDAAAALRLLLAAGAPGDDTDVVAVRPFAAAESPELGRNQPCWCGSGRKYKHCHLGKPAAVPLPERVGWLYHKAIAYLERRGGAAPAAMELAASVLAGDTEAVEEVVSDPLVVDVVLHEGGWLAQFLADRGPLLPPDEAMLAASWLLVERTVHEVLQVRPGAGLTVRDMRTGDRIDVAERTASRTATGGELLCARVVPDGVGHQFVGAVFTVPPGRERDLLALLDGRDGLGLLAWMAAASAPPVITSTDGDPLVACTAVLQVPPAAATMLDERYEPNDTGWASVGAGGLLLGALELDGVELTVRTLTEARMDQLIADLAAELPGSSLVFEDRREPPADDQVRADPIHLDARDVEELQDRFERRWCDEEVPALDGLTPRAAVADPTRRADVVRLIASFPEIDPATGMFGLRPPRLRELLQLD